MKVGLLSSCVGLMLVLSVGPSAQSDADWTRFGFDAGRSNASTADTNITAANVGTLTRQQVTLEDSVDASAIYLANVAVGDRSRDLLFLTTSYGKTIAIDAADGSMLWTFTPDAYSSWFGSAQITTATPVADPDRRSIYTASPDGRIQKLDIATGRPVWSTPITVLPTREKIASPLNYFNGHVIATTGGYVGDAPPYQGHVAVLDASTGSVVSVWNSLCSDRAGLIDPRTCPESGSAIWGRAGAVVDVTTGNIYVATGNGRWDGRTYWGDATVELSPDAARLVGSYTPVNTADLDRRDLDIGSTSPVLLAPGLLLQGGKDHDVRMLGIDRMRTASPPTGGELQTVATPSGNALFTAPAVWRTASDTWVFIADGGGTAGWLLRDGLLQQQWRTSNAGTSPVLAGGLLYVHDPSGGLRVSDPTTGHAVATLDCGGAHWGGPIVVPGLIALPEWRGRTTPSVLNVWRLPRAAHRR